jgi:hypothetical protein
MYLAMGYTIRGASITSATVYHMVGEVSMLVPQYFRGLATAPRQSERLSCYQKIDAKTGSQAIDSLKMIH